jgi:hypothetical protein
MQNLKLVLWQSKNEFTALQPPMISVSEATETHLLLHCNYKLLLFYFYLHCANASEC